MAKKQTRRSISVSRTTYEKLKAFCETNGISMSQFVENRVGDFLGDAPTENADSTPPLAGRPAAPPVRPLQAQPRPLTQPPPLRPQVAPAGPSSGSSGASVAPASPARAPMTSAAARYAVEPPPPIIKRAEQPAPKAPTMPKANEIFTF
jgi:hypothetical protein